MLPIELLLEMKFQIKDEITSYFRPIPYSPGEWKQSPRREHCIYLFVSQFAWAQYIIIWGKNIRKIADGSK